MSFLEILVTSFIGGFLINLMPCILPILPIKVLSLSNMANKDNKEKVKLGTLNLLGTVGTFIFLALILTGIRFLMGGFLVWGFQMQNPYFLGLILFILSLLAMDALDVVNINWGKIQGSVSHKQSGRLGAFFDGVLTTLLASPCCGPILGGAISVSFFLPVWQMVISFGTMGLGLGTPFFLAAVVPGFNKLIPKPGPWINHVKKASGFLIIVLIVWVSKLLLSLL